MQVEILRLGGNPIYHQFGSMGISTGTAKPRYVSHVLGADANRAIIFHDLNIAAHLYGQDATTVGAYVWWYIVHEPIGVPGINQIASATVFSNTPIAVPGINLGPLILQPGREFVLWLIVGYTSGTVPKGAASVTYKYSFGQPDNPEMITNDLWSENYTP